MLIHRRAIHIEWGDCDPAGIVYFPRYLEYFDGCTMRLFEQAGLPKAAMIRDYGIVGIPLVNVQARFLAPSRFGDDVVVESCVRHWRNSSFQVEHRLLRGAALAVEGSETRVWAARHPSDPEGLKAIAIPAEVRRRFD